MLFISTKIKNKKKNRKKKKKKTVETLTTIIIQNMWPVLYCGHTTWGTTRSETKLNETLWKLATNTIDKHLE